MSRFNYKPIGDEKIVQMSKSDTSLIMKPVIFTATADNTTNIDFNSIVSGLNFSTGIYELFYKGVLLDDTNYTVNANNTSIDLTGWSINKDEKIKLKIFSKS